MLASTALLSGCAGSPSRAELAPASDGAESSTALRWPTLVAREVSGLVALSSPCVQRRDGSVACFVSAERAEAEPIAARFWAGALGPGGRDAPSGAPAPAPLAPREEGLAELAWPASPSPFDRLAAPVDEPVAAWAAAIDGGCALVEGGRSATCWGGPWETWRRLPRVAFAPGERGILVRTSAEQMQLTCCAGGCRNEPGHACAVLEGGAVRCWGAGSVGQLGDGSRTAWSDAPAAVRGLTGVRDVALGAHHACALHDDGRVSCWGYDDSGQVGDGAEASVRAAPVEVVGVRGAVAIHAGDYHACARTADGRALCWGRASARGVDAAPGSFPSYASVPGRRIAQLALGGSYTCALDERGDVWCAGEL